MNKKNQIIKTLLQLLAIAIIIAASYTILETALAFLITVVLVAFIIWRNRLSKK